MTLGHKNGKYSLSIEYLYYIIIIQVVLPGLQLRLTFLSLQHVGSAFFTLGLIAVAADSVQKSLVAADRT